MVEVAVLEWSVYVVVVFVLRSWLQLRETGSTGIVGLRAGAGALERAAGVGMVVAFVLGLLGPFVGAPVLDAGWLGPALTALATAATLGAQLAMGASWRIGVRDGERTELVTRFPFSLVRNPIFSAMIGASVGIALTCPTPLALLAPVLLLVCLELQVRRVEEPYLVAIHGAEYRCYAARVGRFLPGLGRL